MPLALECGMSAYEFWYEDIRLFECYVKAYHNRTNKAAWFNGLYVFEAVSAAINNVMPGAIGKAFSKNGKVKPLKYHDKPIEMFEKFPVKQNAAVAKDGNALSGVAYWSERIKKLKGMQT